MTAERPACGLGSLLAMSCRDRAEAFARRLQSRLQTLGLGAPGEPAPPGPLDAPDAPDAAPADGGSAAPPPRPPLHLGSSSDSDVYYDFADSNMRFYLVLVVALAAFACLMQQSSAHYGGGYGGYGGYDSGYRHHEPVPQKPCEPAQPPQQPQQPPNNTDTTAPSKVDDLSNKVNELQAKLDEILNAVKSKA